MICPLGVFLHSTRVAQHDTSAQVRSKLGLTPSKQAAGPLSFPWQTTSSARVSGGQEGQGARGRGWGGLGVHFAVVDGSDAVANVDSNNKMLGGD